MAQQSSSRRLVKWNLILLAAFGLLLVIDHFRGRSELSAARANLRARGHAAQFAELVPAPPPNLKSWTNEFDAAVSNRFQTPFYGSGAAIPLRDGFAAVGSKAPRPPVSWPSPVFTNSVAIATATTNTWEALEAGLVLHAPALKTMRRLLEEPLSNFGFDYVSASRDFSVQNFVKFRTAAQHISDATVIHLHSGNLAEAEADLIALAGCARLNHADPGLVGQMIRVAVVGLSSYTIWGALQHDGWSDEQLLHIQKAWQLDPMPPKVIAALHAERLARVELYEGFRSHTYLSWQSNCMVIMSGWGAKTVLPPRIVQLGNHYVFKPLWNFAWAELEEALWLQSSDYLTNPYQAGGKRHALANLPVFYNANYHFAPVRFYFQVPIAEKFTEIIGPPSVNATINQQHSLLSYLVLPGRTDFSPPNYDKAVEVAAKNENFRQMAITAIALRRYALQKKSYPAELKALVPAFLDEVPRDWYDGEPIRYRLNANGTYTLYTVGADGYDGHGDTTPRRADYPGLTRDDVWWTPVPWAAN